MHFARRARLAKVNYASQSTRDVILNALRCRDNKITLAALPDQACFARLGSAFWGSGLN
jgi:hypothetical protein